jgi:hypothetical protein
VIILREAAVGLLTVVEAAIEAEDWKVDGACDPTVEIIRLKNALAKPNKEWVGLTDEEIEECKINGGLPHAINWGLSAKVLQAKLKEKNT